MISSILSSKVDIIKISCQTVLQRMVKDMCSLTKPKFTEVTAADLLADAEVRPHHKNARRRGDGVPRRMHRAAAAHTTPAHRTGCAAIVKTQL